MTSVSNPVFSPKQSNSRPQVPFLDLQAQFATIRQEVMAAVEHVLEAQHFILGPEVSTLEGEIARFCNSRFAVGVASGTDALILALKAAGVQPGDEVIVPSFSFIATADSVSLLGGKPVFNDIEPETYTLDPSKLEALITRRTRAIVVVHLYGLTADMEPVLSIAAQHGLKVIEDTAQALGARYRAQRAGSMGDIGCISFFPSKNLGGYGDGGMLVTDNEETASRLKRLRAHGCETKYVSEELGWNSRLDELQAAILRVKLRHLEQWTVARREKADIYNKLLADESRIVVPACTEEREHVFHQYTVRVPARDKVRAILADQGVATTVYYPVSICLQPIYRELGYRQGDLPETDSACETVLSLPIYPEMTDAQQEYVAENLIQAVNSI